MDSKTIFRCLSRLRTSDLMVAKIDCTRRIALFRAIKFGLIAVLSVFFSQIAKMIYDDVTMDLWDMLTIPFTAYCMATVLVVNAYEAVLVARKELINDLLTLRMSRAGKGS